MKSILTLCEPVYKSDFGDIIYVGDKIQFYDYKDMPLGAEYYVLSRTEDKFILKESNGTFTNRFTIMGNNMNPRFRKINEINS